MENCLFCEIANKVIETPIIYEDDDFVVIPDKFPKAEIHILILPKKHIASISHAEPSERDTLGNMLLLAKKVAEDKGIIDYKLIFNAGRYAEIPHLHLHLISGGITGTI